MTVKMRKWSPWTPAFSTRKFQVAVKPMKLEGLPEEDDGDDEHETRQKFMAIKIKWKGDGKFFPLMAPFQSKQKKEVSSQKIPKKGSGIIEWDENQWFKNTCCFSVVSDHHDSKFEPWEISFDVLYGEKPERLESKAKMAVIGRALMNISEVAWKMEESSVEQKLPLSLQIDGVARDATLTVLFSFLEIRTSNGSAAITQLGADGSKENAKARRRSLSLEEVSLEELTTTKSRSPGAVLDSDKKEGWFSWTSRRFSFKRAKTKEEKSGEKTVSCSGDSNIDADPPPTVSSPVDSFSNLALQRDDPERPCLELECQYDETEGVWEEKELISRDGQAKFKATVFFASFDQCSDEAAGGSACTVLGAVISHWLHLNSDAMPNRSEFDHLIMEGSSEWRRLCEDHSYMNDFPNKHFDLETVLRAGIRPLSISHNKSFVGFFGADAFDALKGAMSFDDIWNQITSNFGIYIVSWNDHFFVLKAEANAYYIIDTLGERLYEGCSQAYILRFDDEAMMQRAAVRERVNSDTFENENVEEEVICSGKECCREFIRRFLAAIPLKELEEEERKSDVSYFSLHHRLQIEFNYSYLTSSLTSSPLFSLTTATSSPLLE